MGHPQLIDVVIEIPKHSNIKYEYNEVTKKFHVDRILYGTNVYPQNYGFLENTLDWDGDPLDALVFADQPFQVGTVVTARVLGAMKMVDGGETDTKLIAVIDCDPRFHHYQTLKDVPEHYLKEISDFFLNYKNLQNKKVIVSGFEDLAYATEEIVTTQHLYQKYHHLAKDQFIKQMQKEHPEKYLG